MIDLGLNGEKSKTRVVVAMSGGVDSSVAASLCHEAGYDVIGLTMQLYDHGEALAKKGACCAGQDIQDAKRVAEQLGFPHYVLDYESRFKEAVIDDFADQFMEGYTPIPCVRCNQTVKFHDMLEMAKQLGGEALVTGHYIRQENGKLYRGLDETKDQSYFLFGTTKEQAEFLRFPLGGMTKDETRSHAKRLGLAVSDKPESQDICFVPKGDYREVLRKLRPSAFTPGEIVHHDGRVLGTHEGTVNYTLGQRRGLGISWHEDGDGGALYVVKLEPKEARVTVGPKHLLDSAFFAIEDTNWLEDVAINDNGVELEVKIGSTLPKAVCKLFPNGQVELDEPIYAITPGQAAVFYKGEQLLGGGWIRKQEAKAVV